MFAVTNAVAEAVFAVLNAVVVLWAEESNEEAATAPFHLSDFSTSVRSIIHTMFSETFPLWGFESD